MNETLENMNVIRERLIEQVTCAQSLSQVKEAQQALRQWMRDHPEERGMRDGFELLSHLQDEYEAQEAEYSTQLPTKVPAHV